jgi:hypothetical protein
MSEAGHVAFIASELVSLLGRAGHTHLLPAMLTDLYDCMGDVYPTLLAATAPDWINRSLNPDAIGGGFGSRVIVVTAEGPKRRIAWPEGGSEEDFIERCRMLLRHVGGSIHLTPDAQRLYKQWYTTRETATDGYAAAFDSRAADHILKVAGLLALGRGDAELHRSDLRAATTLVGHARAAGGSVFDGAHSHAPGPRDDALAARIADLTSVLEARGRDWISQRDLTQRFNHKLNARGLRNILDVMHDLRMVQRTETQGRTGRPATLWRGTTLLLTVEPEIVLEQVDRSR